MIVLYLFFSYLNESIEQKVVSECSLIQVAFNFAFENDQYNPKGKCYIEHQMEENEFMIEIPQMNNSISDLSCFYV